VDVALRELVVVASDHRFVRVLDTVVVDDADLERRPAHVRRDDVVDVALVGDELAPEQSPDRPGLHQPDRAFDSVLLGNQTPV
jgi:hypothetical protein